MANKQNDDAQAKQEETKKKTEEQAYKAAHPAETEQKYHQEHLEDTDTSEKAEPQNNEITVHVDTTKEADKDPSAEVPTAYHTEGTQGVQGIAAGSATPRVAATGNAQPSGTHGGGVPLPEYPENHDVRELQPSAQEEQQKKEEEQYPRDYALEYDGNRDEELNIKEACESAYNKLVEGSSSVILYRNNDRFVTFVAEEANGQKHISLKPEDGTISDEEADVLNSYNNRVLTGQV